MLSYIVSENLKYRHTFTRKLLWLAPVVTLLLGSLAPVWYQQNSYNWWYILLYPGVLTLLCTMIIQKDGGRLKYRTVYPLPVDLEKVWHAKLFVCIIYCVIANIIFMAGNLLGGFLIFQIYKIPIRIHMLQAFAGTICIILASIWNIPFVLWLAKKMGTFAALLINIGFSSVLGILGADTALWFLCPYSWGLRLMVPVLGILPNGESAELLDLPVAPMLIVAVPMLSVGICYLLTRLTAKAFKEQEVL